MMRNRREYWLDAPPNQAQEAKTRGFPSPPFDGFGFVTGGSNLSIVAGWQIGRRPRMSASEGKADVKTLEILNCDFRCQVLPGFGFIRLGPHNL